MKAKQVTMRSAALAALCLVLGLAAAAAAQPGSGPGCGGPGGPGDGAGPGERMGRHLERLDLTPEQREQLDKLREEGRAEGLALRKELMRLRNELQGEMLKDAPDGKAVEQLAARIGEAQGRLQAHRLRHQLAMRGLLTPEQRDRLLTLRGERGPRGHGCGVRGGHFGRAGRGARHFSGPGLGHGPRDGDGPGRGPRGSGDWPPADCPLHGDGI